MPINNAWNGEVSSNTLQGFLEDHLSCSPSIPYVQWFLQTSCWLVLLPLYKICILSLCCIFESKAIISTKYSCHCMWTQNHPLPQSNNTKNDLWLLREDNLPTQFYVKGTACLLSPGICNYKVAKPKRFHEILATSLMCLYGEGSKQGNISTCCNVFSGQGASQYLKMW
jgi:hypothetical protein